MDQDAIHRLLGSQLAEIDLPADARYVLADFSSVEHARGAATDLIAPALGPFLEREGRLVISMGRCRVGSTALTNLFGAAGAPSLFQPLKAVLRQLLGGSASADHIRAWPDAPLVHAKEMFGPYSIAECLWNPLSDLVSMGLPPNRLTVIWLERDPAASLASWLKHWSPVLGRPKTVAHFVLSSLAAARAAQRLADQGVNVIRFNYDNIQADPMAVLRVFDAVDPSHGLTGERLAWGGRGDLASPNSYITFSPEPAVYGAVKVHSNNPAYAYVTPNVEAVTEDDRAMLSAFGVFDIHAEHRRRCVTAG
jgi:hypothetical protein